MLYHNVVLRAHSEPEFTCELLQEHAERSRKEPGCLRFDVYKAPVQRQTFLLIERWESWEAIDAHRLGASYAEVYRPRVMPRVIRSPTAEGIAYDFDRTLTEHALPVPHVLAWLLGDATTKPVWIVTARNPAYDVALIRDYDEPQRLLVEEAVREWRLPLAGVRFTNNTPKALHLIELGCDTLVDDCPRARAEAESFGLTSIDPACQVRSCMPESCIRSSQALLPNGG